MYAVTKETLKDDGYDKMDCTACHHNGQVSTGKICLPKLDGDKKATPICKCGDGFEPGKDGKCVQVEDDGEYIMKNCPQDSQQSAAMCESKLKVQLPTPQMFKNEIELSNNDFEIKKTYLFLSTDPANSNGGQSPKEVSRRDFVKN